MVINQWSYDQYVCQKENSVGILKGKTAVAGDATSLSFPEVVAVNIIIDALLMSKSY